MKISATTSLKEVAFTVCTALDQAGVLAVLTGGSAATIWTNSAYQSRDCDFIIQYAQKGSPARAILSELGYEESGGTYRHQINRFTLEFPVGPLSIGDDVVSAWDTLHDGPLLLHLLSPTDSCRDRLAAFYYWSDYSALKVAVAIAHQNPIDIETVKSWSQKEGMAEKYNLFLYDLGERDDR